MGLTIPAVQRTFSASGFSLDVPAVVLDEGRLALLVGHNGSGKSLYLKSIIEPLQRDGRRVQLLRQRPADNLAASLTIEQHLLLARRERRTLMQKLIPRRELAEIRAYVARNYSPFSAELSRAVETLSLGQQQILAFLSVRESAPDVMLLDEFLSAADPRTKRYLLTELKRFLSERAGVAILVTHDLNLLAEHRGPVIALAGGRARRFVPAARPETASELERVLFSDASTADKS